MGPILIAATQAITLPYEFEPVVITATTETIDVDLVDVGFINQVGSIAVTIFSILDQFAILGIFVVLMLAVGVLFWIWSVVTETPHTTTLKVFDAAEVAANIYDTQLEIEEGRAERAARLARDPAYYGAVQAEFRGKRDKLERFRGFTRVVKRNRF